MSNIAKASSEGREEILSDRLSGTDRGEDDEENGENGDDRVNSKNPSEIKSTLL